MYDRDVATSGIEMEFSEAETMNVVEIGAIYVVVEDKK